MPTRAGEPIDGGAFTCGAGAVFGVLPGELVDLSTAGLSVLEPSPDRVQPLCIHFGACGGCQYQHARYPAQLGFKLRLLEDLFAGAGLANPSIRTHAADPWEYRNRIRVRLELAGGRLQPGYSRRASNDFLPIRMCPIAAPLLVRAAEALASFAARPSAGGPRAPARWLHSAAEAELFCTPDEGQLQLQLLLARADLAHTQPGSFDRLCEQLRTRIPQLAGAGAAFGPEAARRLRRTGVQASWGAPGLLYEAAGRSYWVSRGAFFQVNRFLAGRLVELVRAGHSGALAWDLFAGVGLFSRPLAERFTRVVAVEGGAAAAADLARAARGGKGQPAFEARHQSTLDFLQAEQHQRDRPSLIVLDPPRAGLGEAGAALLNRIAAPAVVYVSCDPTTLVRDLRVLFTGGYRIESVDLLDLFPQTFHLETVVHLRRD